MSYQRTAKVVQTTIQVTASVTPLWGWTDFDSFEDVHFFVEAPAANTQDVTVTVKRSRFGTNAQVVTEAVTISPGQEHEFIYEKGGGRQYLGEAQSISGTQSIRLIGEGIIWGR